MSRREYDKGLIYSSDGELLQRDYAQKGTFTGSDSLLFISSSTHFFILRQVSTLPLPGVHPYRVSFGDKILEIVGKSEYDCSSFHNILQDLLVEPFENLSLDPTLNGLNFLFGIAVNKFISYHMRYPQVAVVLFTRISQDGVERIVPFYANLTKGFHPIVSNFWVGDSRSIFSTPAADTLIEGTTTLSPELFRLVLSELCQVNSSNFPTTYFQATIVDRNNGAYETKEYYFTDNPDIFISSFVSLMGVPPKNLLNN